MKRVLKERQVGGSQMTLGTALELAEVVFIDGRAYRDTQKLIDDWEVSPLDMDTITTENFIFSGDTNNFTAVFDEKGTRIVAVFPDMAMQNRIMAYDPRD